MKPSAEYFDEQRPFTDRSDACLLDATEQIVAASAENGLWGIGVWMYAHKDADGTPGVGIEARGGDFWWGPTLRDALRAMLNSE